MTADGYRPEVQFRVLGPIRVTRDGIEPVGTYRAIGPAVTFSGDPLTEFFVWLSGGFDDLSCEPNADGSVRFRNHGQ